MPDVDWDPSFHPRDAFGRFVDVISGASASLPDPQGVGEESRRDPEASTTAFGHENFLFRTRQVDLPDEMQADEFAAEHFGYELPERPLTKPTETLHDLIRADSKSKKVIEALDRAAAALSTFMRTPQTEDGQPPGRVIALKGKQRPYGRFVSGGYDSDAIPNFMDQVRDVYEINHNSDDHPALTMIHELGHGLDYGALNHRFGNSHFPKASEAAMARVMEIRLAPTVGNPHMHGTPEYEEFENNRPPTPLLRGPSVDYTPLPDDDAMTRLMGAIRNSPEYRTLADRTGGGEYGDRYERYLLRPTELFARAFEQFALMMIGPRNLGIKLEDPDDIREALGRRHDLWYYQGDNYGEPVMRAMADLLKEMGWNAPRSTAS